MTLKRRAQIQRRQPRWLGGGDTTLPDDALLSAMAVGDEEAAIVFVRRYQRRLYGLAISIVGDSALAEDVAQEAFVRILRHAVLFDPCRGSASSWALTITRNLALDAVRARRTIPVTPDDQLFLRLVSPSPVPGEDPGGSAASPNIRAALGRLPDPQRRAVVLAAVYGRTAGEIAEAERIPLGTAKGRIRLGLEKLRTMIDVTERSP